MKSRRVLVVMFCALAGCIPGQRASYRLPTDAHAGAIPAASVTRIELVAGVGDVRITTDATDSLIYRVALRSQDERRLRETCIPQSRVEQIQEAGVLRLRLDQRSRNQCGEMWTLRLPPGMRVNLTSRLGNVTLEGTFAGVHVRGDGPGSVDGTIASPNVDIQLDHGTIDIVSTRRSHGSIEMRSNNGSVDLVMNGMRIPPGERRGPGASLSLKGDGDGTISLRSGLGDVKLRVGG